MRNQLKHVIYLAVMMKANALCPEKRSRMLWKRRWTARVKGYNSARYITVSSRRPQKKKENWNNSGGDEAWP